MKNKIKIVAIATSLVTAVALIGGTLAMPVLAADGFGKEDYEFCLQVELECPICGTTYLPIEEYHWEKVSSNRWDIVWDKYDDTCPNIANHPTESTEQAEDESEIIPLADGFGKEDVEFELDVKEHCEKHNIDFPADEKCPECEKEAQEPETPETPVEPTEPKEPVNDKLFCKEVVEMTIELPSDYQEEETIITPEKEDNSALIAKLEEEANEARRLADKAQAEADRLADIATEKEAALEAARQ